MQNHRGTGNCIGARDRGRERSESSCESGICQVHRGEVHGDLRKTALSDRERLTLVRLPRHESRVFETPEQSLRNHLRRVVD